MRARGIALLAIAAVLGGSSAWAGHLGGGFRQGTVIQDPGLQRLRGLHQGKGIAGLRGLHVGKGIESIRGLHGGKAFGGQGFRGRGHHHSRGHDHGFRRDFRGHGFHKGFHGGGHTFVRPRRVLRLHEIVVVYPVVRPYRPEVSPSQVSVPAALIVQALESNEVHRWTDRSTGAEATVTPTWTHRRPEGVFCHEFRVDVALAGRVRTTHGEACRYPDGVWEVGG